MAGCWMSLWALNLMIVELLSNMKTHTMIYFLIVTVILRKTLLLGYYSFTACETLRSLMIYVIEMYWKSNDLQVWNVLWSLLCVQRDISWTKGSRLKPLKITVLKPINKSFSAQRTVSIKVWIYRHVNFMSWQSEDQTPLFLCPGGSKMVQV